MPYLGALGLEFKKSYCHVWNQYPWICLIAKYCEIMKMSKFGTKSALFGYFWARILKNYCHIWNQHLRISVIAKNFMQKQKCLNLGPKMPYLGIFDQKCLIWVVLGKNFKKDYCHVWNQHLQICLFAKFHEKTKMPKSGTKNAWFRYSWAGIWKQFCHIWNQHPRICLIAKFRGKTKIPKFVTKNALFGYFWPKMPYLCVFWARILKNYIHVWNQHPQICLTAKFCEKTKIPKFETKNALFGYFWARILKNYCHILNQHPQISRKWVFNSYSKFWYRVRFFWRSGSGSWSAL